VQNLPMAQLRDVVIDCRRPARLARFWSGALEDYEVAPYDDAEIDRLRKLGVEDPEEDPTVLVDCRGPGPRLWFQSVPEAKTVKNRVHLDLGCDDVDAELGRLRALGATVLPDQQNDTLIVLADPEGNEFCLLR
jgi:hypothetical protein